MPSPGVPPRGPGPTGLLPHRPTQGSHLHPVAAWPGPADPGEQLGLGVRAGAGWEGSAEPALSPGGGPPAAGAWSLPEEPLRGLSEPQVPAGGGTATLTQTPDLQTLTSLGLHLWPLTPINLSHLLTHIDL